MARKTIDADGTPRSEKITLSLTPSMAEQVRALAEISGKSTNELIISVLVDAIKKNASLIDAITQARRSYQAIVNKANAEYLAQEATI